MSYSGMRFVDKLHADYYPCLTLVWGSWTSYTQTTIHVLLRYEVCWQVTHRLQSMSYSGMGFVDRLHADYNPCLTPIWGSLTSYTQTTIHVLLRYEVLWQVTHRLQSMSYSGMRFVNKLHTDYNPCLTLVWGSLTSYTKTTIHVLLRYEVRWQFPHRLQSMSYSGMRFVDKLHTDYNPCLTLVWGSLTSYTQTTIHVYLWYEVCWQDTQTAIHVLLWYEVWWQVTRRLQSMSYSGMRFVDKLHTDYNPCLTPLWGSLTSYTQITIHVSLWYEVCWQVTRRLQSISYSGVRLVDKLNTDYNPCLTLVWGLLTSYTRTTIHVLLQYEVRWQVTHRLQSMSYSGMRFVDKLHTDYNPYLTLVWGSLTSYTQTTIHVLLRFEVCWQVTHRPQSMAYSGLRFVDKLHTDYNPCLTLVWGLLTSYTQTTIHVLLRFEVCWQDTHRLQSMSYYVWGSLTSYTQTTTHVLLRYEFRWQVTHRLQSYSGMRFVDMLQTDYNPCLTPVWGSLTSYTQTIIHVLFQYEVLTSYTVYNPCPTLVWGLLTSYRQTKIHVLLRYEVRWQVTHRLQSMSYSGVRFVDKLHTDYNPCLTLVWGSLTSYTQKTIDVLLWYEVCWQVTRRLQSMSYSGMRFVDKLHADYNPCITLVWGLLTSYTQTTIHVLLWYEVRWQVTHRLQSMSYSGMRFVDKLHRYYNPCLTLVWGLLTSYTQITIHILLRYEVCWQVTHILQSMSYSGMRFVDKLHADFQSMSYSGMRFVDKLHADYNPSLTLVWGLLTSYTQTTIHVLLPYEVPWQVTHRLQSMSYSGMRFVDNLNEDYNPCLTPVWGSLTSYTQTTIHVLLRYEVRWQVTHRLQSMSYSIMRFVDKLHTYYNPCLTLVWGLLTGYTQTTIHVLLWYEVCWQVTHRLQFMSYSGMRFVDKLHTDYNTCLTPLWGSLTSYTHITIHVLLWYEVCWQVTHRLQSMSYSGMRFVDRLHTDYNPWLTPVWGLLTSYTQTTIHVLLRYEVRWQVTYRLQSMSYSGMRFVDKLHTDYNPCLTPVWGLLTRYTQTTIHVLLRMRFVDKLHTDYHPCLTPVWVSLTSYTQTTVLLRYEVRWHVTNRLQSMSYSGMRFVDKLHTDYNPCLIPVWGFDKLHSLQSMSYSGMRFVDRLHTDYNPWLTPVWGLLTSYTQTTIHVLLRYEVRWQVTYRLQSMSYSGMRFVDKLHTDYNPCITPVWGLLTRYTQTTIHVLLRMRFVDKLHTDYHPCLIPVWVSLTSYTQTTVLLRYEVRWHVTNRLQSMSYSGMRFVDKLHTDYNPCLIPVWGFDKLHSLQSMSYSGMRFVDKLHAD